MKYEEKDLVRIAKRENNAMRSYLVVDPLQGKHVPVSPGKALAVFEALADEIKLKFADEKLLVVGFAETATAIGAQVAISLGAQYIQTTREMIPDVQYLFFSEAHSHATEQKLVKDDMDRIIPEIDRIVFVEDEVTTGNTILNIVRIIRQEYEKKMSFSVLSLLNGMMPEHIEQYNKENITLDYLVKTDHSAYTDVAETFAGNGTYTETDATKQHEIFITDVEGKQDARRLVDASDYQKNCEKLAEDVIEKLKLAGTESILVVGTEESMYPALLTGSEMEKLGCVVKCHSTTRSPIAVSNEIDYPVHTRYELLSLYDSQRRTFLYDIDGYDRAVVITDSALTENAGLHTLVNALKTKNEKIDVIRWC